MATHMVAAAKKTFHEITGVVVKSGLMQKTATVRVGNKEWNPTVQKYFKKPINHLVHDPNDSLRTGDVVAISPGWRTSRHKRFIVERIISPAGIPIEERPPVPTQDERWAEALAKRAAKDERRAVIKEARSAQEMQEASSRREARKIAKRLAKKAAAEQDDAVRQAEELMRAEEATAQKQA